MCAEIFPKGLPGEGHSNIKLVGPVIPMTRNALVGQHLVPWVDLHRIFHQRVGQAKPAA